MWLCRVRQGGIGAWLCRVVGRVREGCGYVGGWQGATGMWLCRGVAGCERNVATSGVAGCDRVGYRVWLCRVSGRGRPGMWLCDVVGRVWYGVS